MKKQYILDEEEFDALSSKLHDLMWTLYDMGWTTEGGRKKEVFETLAAICVEMEEVE